MVDMPRTNEQRAIAAVIIGRNEGERLRQCLRSMADSTVRMVYVDSGSTDGSAEAARAAGAHVVQLDLSRPFTAARARNAGFAALVASDEPIDFVQFIDGDCRLVPGWLDAARDALIQNPALGIVTGWRSEIASERSVYNAMCDFEWRRPAGNILTCGGDMMVRRSAFEEVGGFNDSVIAAEDDEFCVRVRAAGWAMCRLPVEMTRHDAAMLHFRQWWQRAVRSGHGFAQVGDLHPAYFTTERRRVWIFGGVLPALALGGALVSPWLVLGVGALYAASYARTAAGLRRDGLPLRKAALHASFLALSKFPNLQGMLTYWRRRLKNGSMEIIEYK
jgi:GT2 family glycosyltransferase